MKTINEEYAKSFLFKNPKIIRPLTKEEFECAVNEAVSIDDEEISHIYSDMLMENQLTALGYDVSKIQESERWYS